MDPRSSAYFLPSSLGPTNLLEECSSDFMDLLVDCSSDFKRSDQKDNCSRCSTNFVHASVGSPDRFIYHDAQLCPSDYAPDEWILDLLPEPSHPAWCFTSTNGTSNRPLNLPKPTQPETTPLVPRTQSEPRQYNLWGSPPLPETQVETREFSFWHFQVLDLENCNIGTRIRTLHVESNNNSSPVFDLKFAEKYLIEASNDMPAINSQMEILEAKLAKLKDDINQLMQPFTYPETGVTRLASVNNLKDTICNIKKCWVNIKQDIEPVAEVISRLDVMLGDVEMSDALAEADYLTILRKNLTDLDWQTGQLFTKLIVQKDNLDELENIIVGIEEHIVNRIGWKRENKDLENSSNDTVRCKGGVFDSKFIEKYQREASIDMHAMNNRIERLEAKFAWLKDEIHQMMEPFTYPETTVTRLTLVNELKDSICDIRQCWVNVKQDFEGNSDVISRLDVMLGDLETSDALAESAALTVLLRKNLIDLDAQTAELFTKLVALKNNIDQLEIKVKIEELVVKLRG